MSLDKPSFSPRGVPLHDLEAALKQTTLKALRDGDTLVIEHEQLVTVVEVAAPENADAGDATIEAIVTIKTELPSEFGTFFITPGRVTSINRLATLGAVVEEEGKFYVGSRLTVYEGEDAWNGQFGFVLLSIIVAADTLLGAARRSLTREAPRAAEPSAWTERDFQLVRSTLSRVSVCTLGGLGLTAEFVLRTGEVSAIAGHRTAIWQMMADEPHPEMGAGLFCLLNMPHEIADKEELERVIGEMNRLEMKGNNWPPHFGAWCAGAEGNNPAYVSFLPNLLHSSNGIALKMSSWAMSRAQIADAMLLTMGVR